MFLAGSITALVTPFEAGGSLDRSSLAALIERQIAGGSRAVVIAGSTGEAAALTTDEYCALLEAALQAAGGRIPVLAGSGLSSTRATIEQTRRAAAAGAAAALVVTPPYVRPTQAGLVAHYRAVAAEGGLPVVLYNVPSRTGVDLLPASVAELLDTPGIIGIKEAKVDAERIRALVALKRPGQTFAVLSGDDGSAGESVQLGADGVISVASNLAPRQMQAWIEAARAARGGARCAPAAALEELIGYLAIEPNPIAIKALLAAAGHIQPALRLPLLASATDHELCRALAMRVLAGESATG